FRSSGDLIADRRFALAQELKERGDLAAAADLLVQAIEAAPRFISAWFALAELRERLRDRDGAVAAPQQGCPPDADDTPGGGLPRVRLGGRRAGDMPTAYVRALFDQYAPQFDTALTERLAYRGPGILRDAVERACAAEPRPARFPDMLDLGCGTGLAG